MVGVAGEWAKHLTATAQQHPERTSGPPCRETTTACGPPAHLPGFGVMGRQGEWGATTAAGRPRRGRLQRDQQ